MDEDIFDQPREFRPERFLDTHGQFVKHPSMIPFGIGKRNCLGEILARQELFLFTAVLIQNFKFVLPDGVDKIDEEGIEHFVYSPKPFRIRALSR